MGGWLDAGLCSLAHPLPAVWEVGASKVGQGSQWRHYSGKSTSQKKRKHLKFTIHLEEIGESESPRVHGCK